MTIHSESTRVNASGQRVYDFLTDFTNFGQLLPEQVSHWEATADQCSFSIEGLAKIRLGMGECTPVTHITYNSFGETPISFSLGFNIIEFGSEACDFQVSLDANLNPMLEMMAKRPLQNFIDILTHKLQEIMEMPRN